MLPSKPFARGVWLTTAATLFWISPARPQVYPEASLDQATYETIGALTIDRYEGLDDEGMRAEYEWALDMAKLCLSHPDRLPIECRAFLPAEFQRHAGRTARYLGFAEQAIEDYTLAIDYAYRMERFFPPPHTEPVAREEMTLRDIADTYIMMGAFDSAAQVSERINDSYEERGQHFLGTPPELRILAEIAEGEGRFGDMVRRQQQAIRAQHESVVQYLDRHPELSHIDRVLEWSRVVDDPGVQVALWHEKDDDKHISNDLRNDYCRLARAFRLSGKLDEAENALRTATLTPWKPKAFYRERLDLWVDREWAFLALAQGKSEEALGRAEECLGKYVMSHAERVELLDLVSRALEQFGDLQAAFDKLKEAIGIVENKRANLIRDENKQNFVASYASLYRRALDLVIRIHEKHGTDVTKRSFEWSERVKARAMLDTINRYDRRMAQAIADGDTDAMRSTRDLAGKVISLDELRNAPWWPGDTALLEYTYGGKKGSRGQGIEGSRGEGTEQAPPLNPPLPRGDRGGSVYLWVVTGNDASFRRLAVRTDELDKRCDALAEALHPNGDRSDLWVEPASWLYQQTIAPVTDKLQGIKRLIIVGDGKLCTTPFEVFVAGRNAHPDRYVKHRLLIEDFTIAYAPSGTLLDAISRRERPKAWDYSLWAFASTKFKDYAVPSEAGPKSLPKDYKLILRSARSMLLDDLPHTAREVEQVRSGFGSEQVEVFINRPNMKTKLLKASEAGTLRSVRFLHFATHAVTDPGRPYLTGLVLSPPYPSGSHDAEPDPESEAASKHGAARNGKPVLDKPTWRRKRPSRPELLTIGELAGLDLKSELVVLSACRSLGDKTIEGDWLNGLTRAFLVAGGSGVVCTTMETADQAAISVVPTLYHALRTQGYGPGASTDVPKALQEVKRSRLGSRMYGHPSAWAPWVYHGRVCSD